MTSQITRHTFREDGREVRGLELAELGDEIDGQIGLPVRQDLHVRGVNNALSRKRNSEHNMPINTEVARGTCDLRSACHFSRSSHALSTSPEIKFFLANLAKSFLMYLFSSIDSDEGRITT